MKKVRIKVLADAPNTVVIIDESCGCPIVTIDDVESIGWYGGEDTHLVYLNYASVSH